MQTGLVDIVLLVSLLQEPIGQLTDDASVFCWAHQEVDNSRGLNKNKKSSVIT